MLSSTLVTDDLGVVAELCRCVVRCAVQNCNPTMCNTSGIPRAPPPSPTGTAAIAGRLQKMSVKAGDAPRRSAAHQVSSGSESNGTPSAPPPRTLSISPLQRDDETAELEARVLRLARACAARGRRAARRDRGRSQSRSRSRSQIRRDVPPTMDSDADDERDSETEHASPLRHLRRLAPRAQSGKRVRIEDNLRQARCRPRTASWGDAEAARTRRADQCGNQPVHQAGLESPRRARRPRSSSAQALDAARERLVSSHEAS